MAALILVASDESRNVAGRVESFVRDIVIPYEKDRRYSRHGPTDELVAELRELARAARLVSPHIKSDGAHFSQRDTALILRKTGLSPLGPLACNTMAPDEGNMYLLGRVADSAQRTKFLQPLVQGTMRSAFLMTEPAEDNGAGSDPGMLQTTAVPSGHGWIINGRKTFISGFVGATVGIVLASTGTRGKPAATMFLIALPNPAITVERVLDTIDSSVPGGHAQLSIRNLRVSPEHILGELDQGFRYAQIRLAPARLSHCMRWHGAATRAQEIATAYACNRRGFGKLLIDHEGVGFQLADNMIDLQQAELMINWCADSLDQGSLGTTESSMTKVAVADALFRVADRCVQVMGGTGVARDTVVEQIFREIRAFRIYDGPTEVHKWSLAKKIKRKHLTALA